jgi:hypothetical protein
MIYAFAGKKHSGKSTICKYLSKTQGYIVSSFGNELKNIVSTILGVSRETLEDIKNNENYTISIFERDIKYISSKTDINSDIINEVLSKKSSYNPRTLLQVIGTDIIRRHNPDWHLKNVKIEPGIRYCIDDLRFPNEKKYIENLGGKCIYIDRMSINTDTHESENALSKSDFEYTLSNNLDIETLKLKFEMMRNWK